MALTNRAILFLLGTAVILAAATWVSGLQWVAGGYLLLMVGLVAVDWWQAEGVERFEVVRQHDNKLSLGAENPVKIHIHNRNGRLATFWLRDEPPDAFRLESRILSGNIAAFKIWEGVYHIRPLQRGDYQFGNINLRWLGPMGLVVRQGKIAASEAVKVYPNLLDVRRYDLLLRKNRLQEFGLRSSRQFGEGTEFERLREYLPDDEYRRINWKATARRNRPVTIEYQTERSQTIMAVLDLGRMMQSPVADIAKLDYVVNAVLLLGYVATGKGDKVGLMSFADTVQQYLTPKQGRGQFYRMLEVLYRVKAQPVEPDYRRALSYFASKQRKRALVVIFTDLSGGMSMQSLVSQVALLARHSLPLVVTISDPDVVAMSQKRPIDSLSVYQRSAAAQLLDERQITLDTLRRQGVLTLDVPANQLSIAVINRYLELKARTML